MNFQEKLKKLEACKSAVDWVGEKTISKAWAECQRGDWMLWLINKANPKITLATRRTLVLCACDLAETALKYVPKDEKRPAEAINIARAWAKGEKISLDDVKNASYAAYAASYSAYDIYASYAAFDAATVTAYASYAAFDAAYAAYAVYASCASVSSASAATDYAAYADIVRKYFPEPPKI